MDKINIYSRNAFVFIFVSAIIYVLTYSIFYYTPILGYDGEAHFSYVNYIARYLPDQLKIPSPEDT